MANTKNNKATSEDHVMSYLAVAEKLGLKREDIQQFVRDGLLPTNVSNSDLQRLVEDQPQLLAGYHEKAAQLKAKAAQLEAEKRKAELTKYIDSVNWDARAMYLFLGLAEEVAKNLIVARS